MCGSLLHPFYRGEQYHTFHQTWCSGGRPGHGSQPGVAGRARAPLGGCDMLGHRRARGLGTHVGPVQELRWGCEKDLASDIGCHNRDYTKNAGWWTVGAGQE